MKGVSYCEISVMCGGVTPHHFLDRIGFDKYFLHVLMVATTMQFFNKINNSVWDNMKLLVEIFLLLTIGKSTIFSITNNLKYSSIIGTGKIVSL